MTASDLWKAPFKIFGLAFFALVSFVVLLFLFSLFFAGAGAGLGAMLGQRDLARFSTPEDSLDLEPVYGDSSSENLLLLVPVDGIILGSPSLDFGPSLTLSGATYGYPIKELLRDAAEDERIQGVLLHMQTPGGTIYGSRAIFDGVKAYRETTDKPVFAFVEGLSASGGVMAMAGADKIFADRGSRVGSIGVIAGMLTYFDDPVATEGGLMGGGIETRGGIEHTIIAAGRGKDIGNPFRRPTEEEISVLQAGADDEYDRFVSLVAENRPIAESVIRDTMGALIFGNAMAESYGLIDGTLNREETIRRLAEQAGVADDFQLVAKRSGSRKFWRQLLSLWDGAEVASDSVERAVRRDLCRAATRLPLAYHGDLSALCAACREEGTGIP